MGISSLYTKIHKKESCRNLVRRPHRDGPVHHGGGFFTPLGGRWGTGPVVVPLLSGPLVRSDTLLFQELEQVEMPASQVLGGSPFTGPHLPPSPLTSRGIGALQPHLEPQEQQGKKREVADGAPHASELRRSPRR